MNTWLFSEELKYLFLFFTVLILPKALLRFRIPEGISCLALGVLTHLGLGWFEGDELVKLLATLGITSLFLFAGMEVEVEEIKKDYKPLLKFLTKSTIMTLIIAFALSKIFDLSYRASVILGIGLLTPSTGFILNSLDSFEFNEDQRYWIRSKAISKEIIAIFILFVTLQSTDLMTFLFSLGALITLIFIIPKLFSFFLKVIAPYAPNTEVAFLVLIALICGVITKKLGTYYLVGAFIAGIIAGQFKHFISGKESDKIIHGVSAFFGIFVPFYFFKAGQMFESDFFNINGILLGLVFFIVIISIRVLSTFISIKLFLSEHWKNRLQITISLMPTLIFGLVIASILKERFQISNEILAGLIIYTVLSSIIPSLVFKKVPPAEYDITKVGD